MSSVRLAEGQRAGVHGDAPRDAERFQSILFPKPTPAADREVRNPPSYFHDLHLDRIVAAVAADWQEYDLEPFFHVPLRSLDVIEYRQEVMRDLEHEEPMQAVRVMAERLQRMRWSLGLAKRVRCKPERERWFLTAAREFCEAVEGLAADLARAGDVVASRGLRALKSYLAAYLAADSFVGLREDVRRLEEALGAVRYGVLLRGDAVTVRAFEDDLDYVPVVEATFQRFRRGAARDYRAKFTPTVGLNHVEAQVLDRVALLYPETFAALADFCVRHAAFIDETIATFDREIHVYVAYLELCAKLRRAGLPVCFPSLSTQSKNVAASDAYDLALAIKRLDGETSVVRNDFSLRGRERIFVVSGPNQGGKTTFARLFGQLHHLASLGCPVPASRARLWIYDDLFTHFEREERLETLRGKLEDDLVRIRRVLDAATPNSIVLLNELFSSTTLEDALLLSRRVMEKLSALDALGVWVTFLDELAAFGEKTVSLVAGVDPVDPTIRTFRLERRPADGLAYALAIAEKYGLTQAQLEARIVTESPDPRAAPAAAAPAAEPP